MRRRPWRPRGGIKEIRNGKSVQRKDKEGEKRFNDDKFAKYTSLTVRPNLMLNEIKDDRELKWPEKLKSPPIKEKRVSGASSIRTTTT